MSEWLRAMGPAVGNHLWQTTVFAAMAWGVTRLLRKNQARVRYGVWLAASVKFLVPFSLLVGLGGMLPRPQHAVVAMPVYSAVDEVGMPFSDESLVLRESEETHISRPRYGAPTLVAVATAGVWACGTLVVLAMWCGGWWRVMRTLRRARRVEAGREAEILRRVQEAMSWRRAGIGLVLSDERMEPGMFGIFRQVLIWPAQLSDRLDDEHIEAIVAHELMHAGRRDNLTAAVHMLVEAAFWFHPAVWWMERRMVDERERACDEAVVAMGSRPGVYAESLLRACRFCVESPLVCVAGITGADLAARVRSIMTLRLERLGWGRRIVLGLLALAAVGAPILLGQAKAAQRMMLAAVKAAPAPFRLAARAMMPLEETPSMGLIAEAQAPSGADAPLPQAQAEAKPFTFDVVSIRRAVQEPDGLKRRIGLQFTDDGFVADGQSLVGMLMSQYRSQLQAGSNSVVGGPDWARMQGWDIRAKVADSDVAEWSKFSHDSSVQAIERRNATIQALLAERFKLKTNFESKEGTVYALVVAKGGPKLTASTSDARASVTFGPGRVSSPRMRLAGLAQLFTLDLGHPVIDKTGLAGDYAISVNWTPAQGGAGSTGGDAGQASAPGDASASLFTAVQEQLGLKLEAQKGPIETLVIDSAEKPSVDGAEVPASATPVTVSIPNSDLPSVKFSVVYFKRSLSYGSTKVDLPATGDYVAYHGVPIGRLIIFAYDHNGFWTTTGEPDWVDRDWYDFQAKVAAEDVAVWQTTPLDKKRLMVRALLGDVLKLKAHQEFQQEPIYDLVVGKGGPKMTEWKEGDTVKDRNGNPVTGPVLFWYTYDAATCQATNMGDLALSLSGPHRSGRTVVDKTGLTGRYNFTLPIPYQGSPQEDEEMGMSVSDAVQTLGLKLVADKGQTDKLVIDNIERPPEN